MKDLIYNLSFSHYVTYISDEKLIILLGTLEEVHSVMNFITGKYGHVSIVNITKNDTNYEVMFNVDSLNEDYSDAS